MSDSIQDQVRRLIEREMQKTAERLTESLTSIPSADDVVGEILAGGRDPMPIHELFQDDPLGGFAMIQQLTEYCRQSRIELTDMALSQGFGFREMAKEQGVTTSAVSSYYRDNKDK